MDELLDRLGEGRWDFLNVLHFMMETATIERNGKNKYYKVISSQESPPDTCLRIPLPPFCCAR